MATGIATAFAYLGLLLAALLQRSRRNLISGNSNSKLRPVAWFVPSAMLLVSAGLLYRSQGPAFGALLLIEIVPLAGWAVAFTVRRPRRAFRLVRALTTGRRDLSPDSTP